MLIWTLVILGTVALDQLTKYLTILYLKPVPTVPLWEGVLHLTYVENTGAAFGMMKDQRWLFMTVSTLAIVGLLVYFYWRKPTGWMERLALTFIIGGGIGNMIDRVLLGYVVDMIDFRLINFAVFNVADSFVCVGVGLMMLCLIRSMIAEYKLDRELKRAKEAGELDEEADADDEADETVAPDEPPLPDEVGGSAEEEAGIEPTAEEDHD